MASLKGKPWLFTGAIFVLSIGMLACAGGAPAPGTEETGQKIQLAKSTMQMTVVNPKDFPEPAEGAMGWIPPEDLTATPKRGGILKISAGNQIRLDPHLPNFPASEQWLARVYTNGLLKWDIKINGPVLDLAESWEVAPDGMSYTFKIRKGVKFHNVPPVNGRELKAEDVKWSLDRVSGLSRQPGQASFNYARFETLKEVQVVDDYTVRLVMKQPDNMFLRELMYSFTTVLPKEAAIDNQFNEGKTLIGTGPFITELAQPSGMNRFKRNPDYFDKGADNKPYLDGIEAHAISIEGLAPAFRTKQLDWVISAYTTLKPVITDPQMRPQLRMFSTRGNAIGFMAVSMNPNILPFNDIRVRRAVHLAIDRDEWINLAFGGPEGGYPVGPLGGYWVPWLWSEEKLRSLPGWRQPKDQDLAEAKKLLAEAGYAGGLNVTCECENVDRGDVLVQQLKRVGINVTLNIVPPQVLRFQTYMKDKQMSDSNQGGLHTPDGTIVQSYLCNAAKNMSPVCDEEIEKLHKEFRKTFDQEKAIGILEKVQQRLVDIMVAAPVIRSTSYHVSYKYVRGWRNDIYDVAWANGPDMVNVWLDK